MVKGNLCRFFTADGLELQGFFASPGEGVAPTTLVHIHGLSGNFYENRFLDQVAEGVVGRGLNFFSFNNRGHDYFADFLCQDPGTGRYSYEQIGGAYEAFEDCVPDLDAALQFVSSVGSERVVLQGHSHGALKAVYYLFRAQRPQVVGLSLLSPSDDLGVRRAQLEDGFELALAEAKRLVDSGRPTQLLAPGYFEYPISVATYLNSFGEGSALGLFNLSRTDREAFPELRSMAVPVLLVVGTFNEAFLGDPGDYVAAARAELTNAAAVTDHIIAGAPHNYLGFEQELTKTIVTWLADRSEMAGDDRRSCDPS